MLEAAENLWYSRNSNSFLAWQRRLGAAVPRRNAPEGESLPGRFGKGPAGWLVVDRSGGGEARFFLSCAFRSISWLSAFKGGPKGRLKPGHARQSHTVKQRTVTGV
jgi:hypothetical protein